MIFLVVKNVGWKKSIRRKVCRNINNSLLSLGKSINIFLQIKGKKGSFVPINDSK